MKHISDIIKSIDSDFPNVNPTNIYNEGWMTRLLISQSLKEKTKLKGFDFSKISNWTSEALISSPFIKADQYPEGHTHADIALGDFNVDFEKSGKIFIPDNAKIFGIIEAKMGSILSKGTKHFKDYNQASRNLACISSQTYNNKECEIFFIVVAPEIILLKNKIEKQIDLQNMIVQIKERFREYSDSFKLSRNMDSIISKAETCTVKSWSYEDWIDAIENPDSKEYLSSFYGKAKKWNRIKNKL